CVTAVCVTGAGMGAADRKVEAEGGALADGALDPRRSVVGVGDGPDDGEPQAGAAAFGRGAVEVARPVGTATETFEDAGGVFWCHPGAGVAHPHPETALVVAVV